MKPIFLLNGPNLNLVGFRDPKVYGAETLAEIVQKSESRAKELGLKLHSIQTNHEGEIIEALHIARENAAGVIINAGAFSHTSIAIRDALECLSIPKIEVHLSNIYAREEFRRHSVLSEVVTGVICGFGANSYLLALDAISKLL